MRTTFIEALAALADQDDRIWLLSSDLGYSVLGRFAQLFPKRYVDMGVAGQNMIGVATGLALEGKVVFTYSSANLLATRCVEQIRNDLCFPKLSVKIVAVGSGTSNGALGYTHRAMEDLAMMRAMPNMMVLAPGDPVEVRLATRAIANWRGPCYLWLGNGGEPIVRQTEPALTIGKVVAVREGSDVP